jgi:hypothetical protein
MSMKRRVTDKDRAKVAEVGACPSMLDDAWRCQLPKDHRGKCCNEKFGARGEGAYQVRWPRDSENAHG